MQTTFPHAEDLDPALIAFEHACSRHGLEAQRLRGALSSELHARVAAGQTWRQKALWLVCGYWDGMVLYKIRKKESL